MIKSLIPAVLLGASIFSSAYAAPFNGWYAGVQGGYEDYHASDKFTGAGILSGLSASTSGSLSGAVGGIYGGYGRTFERFYLGIEAQGDLADTSESTSSSGITSEVKHTYSYGLSVRPGFEPIDNLLIYTRLGWIASHFEQSYSGLLTGSTSATPSGIDTGLGVEYAFTPNLSARLDWTYANYQDVNITTTLNGANIGTDKISPDSNTFRIGIAYNF
jgi:outer membrane immunogenic protein